MSDNEIKIKASVEDEASNKLNKVGKSVGDLSTKAKETSNSTKGLSASVVGLGVALGNIAFNVVTNAIKGLGNAIVGAIRDFANGEKITNRLTAALKNQGIYSQYLIKDYENFAKEMRNYSGVADDVIKDNMTLLTNYGLMGDELKQATKAAMTLSVGLGTDLKSATMMVARAAEGNTTAFAGYGITIKDTGSKAKNFQEILKGVEDKFGDLAKVNTDNLSTQVAVLKENWEDLKKELVSGFVPILNTVIGKINNWIASYKDPNKELKRQIEYQKTAITLAEKNLEKTIENNERALSFFRTDTTQQEQKLAKMKEHLSAMEMELKIQEEIANKQKETSDEVIANKQKEIEQIRQKEEKEKQVTKEREKREEKELKEKEELEKKKLDLKISAQKNALNNIADLNKVANDYELAEKINYYEKDYQSKKDSLDRQIKAMQENQQTEIIDYALLLEQKKALDDEYQQFIDEKNELVKEKGTDLHDFNIWLAKDETKSKLQVLQGLATAQTSNIKALAEVAKAAAISTATVDTYLAATKALATFPIPISYIMAAAVTAQGLENVAKIAGVQFASGTDYIPQDMVATVHQGEIIVPRTFSDALRSGDIALSSPDFSLEEETNNNQSSNNNQTIIINIENNGDSIDELAEKIRDKIAKNIATGTMRPFPTKEKI